MGYKIMDGNEACAYVAYNFTEIAGIYPITPSSAMAEYIDQWSSEGKTNFFGDKVKVIEMESEAGAAGMIHGALQNGSIASTFTASQGLLLMIPNMYKIAGEMLPGVINVAARTLASHSLSILGDHQDIYSVRQTGFAILANSSVQQVMDLTSVAYLSALDGKIPFLNFFDGFRTSHELQKVELLDMDKVKKLINEESLKDFKSRALSNNVVTRGTNQNDDIFFQVSEARNKYYDDLPDIVNNYMEEISLITGREYKPFNYYGSKKAKKVIVAMGSVCETIKETIDFLNKGGEELGLIEVHLYRPFSSKYLLNVLPKTVEKVAVLDRTKENGSAEPLYLDVLDALKGKNIDIIGGRYGLSSKNTTPYQIKAVYDFLDDPKKFNGFTIGIFDDVTNKSLKEKKFDYDNGAHEILIYGFGSDGMVTASKDIIKITGTNTEAYTQGYFEYDSKKSGGLTRCHLRFSKKPIRSTYYVQHPSLVVCTKDNYLSKYYMLDNIEENGVFVINTTKTQEELFNFMTNRDKKIIKERNIKMYMVNATRVSFDVGLGNKINTIIETIIFKLSKIIPFKFAEEKMKANLEALFGKKGPDVVEKNVKAIDQAIENLVEVDTSKMELNKKADYKKTVFDLIDAKMGDKLRVSEVEEYIDGTFEGGKSKDIKKDIADMLPVYDSSKCITCNQCSFVCPHGVVRPFIIDEEEFEHLPEGIKAKAIPANIPNQNYKFVIGINIDNCTGCGLCVNTCPGKRGDKALNLKPAEEVRTEINIEENMYLFNNISEKKNVFNPNTVKGSQFIKPKFEYSGACAGCGETPYIKLLSQLFGNELVISNATGCSSIYGGGIPATPYSVPWANSLFEDNAEFGFGMEVADRIRKDKIRNIIEENIHSIPKTYQEICASYYKNPTYENSCLLYEAVDNLKIKELKEMKEFIKTKSFWIIGGDGWAYDIGFNGLDHVISNRENINILVLDTEVYSNTGGQSSKSSKVGSIAKFTSAGKENAKKDLAKIALTYPHVYVGTISLGANMQQAINTLNEAKNYNGPSIVIAYAPCIAQGILKGMSNSIEEEKLATQVGYFPIFRYNPETKEFKLDSKAEFDGYKEFLLGESRYRNLQKINPDKAEELYNQNEENAKMRYEFYESLDKKDS